MAFWAFLAAAGHRGLRSGRSPPIRQNSWVDYLAVGVSIGAQVVPNFVLAPILVLVFTLWLHWLPGGGWNDGHWSNVILPVIALSATYLANIARIMRSSMLEVLNSNFIRTARAKGMPGYQVIFKHALRPALLPVVSYLGPVFVGHDHRFGGGRPLFFHRRHRAGVRQQRAQPRLFDHPWRSPSFSGALTIAGNLVCRHPLCLDRPEDPIYRRH